MKAQYAHVSPCLEILAPTKDLPLSTTAPKDEILWQAGRELQKRNLNERQPPNESPGFVVKDTLDFTRDHDAKA